MILSSMTEADTRLDALDRNLAPGLLVPFADDMARRLSRISMGPLLEIAAETGVLTQSIASTMSAGMIIIATDPDPDMVAHAQARPGVARVTFQQADPAALPFADATFGIVACHFGVVAMPDRRGAFLEARRVMKPGARFVFSLPAHIRHNPVADCLHDALTALFPADPPTFLARTLHGYADNDRVDDDLTAAGFTDAIYTSVELPYVAASARDAALGYCLGSGLRTELEARAPGDIASVIQAAAAALQQRFGSGPIETTMRAHIISAAG
jgi:ubiquinone/menaquinone biosynthesis C-methylase UbiE